MWEAAGGVAGGRPGRGFFSCGEVRSGERGGSFLVGVNPDESRCGDPDPLQLRYDG